MRRALHRAAAPLLVAALVVAGCDDERSSTSTSAPPPDTTGSPATTSGATPPSGASSGARDRTAEVARACTAVLDERDRATFDAGSKASLAVVVAAVRRRSDAPDERERSAWRNALVAARDALVGDRDRLAAVSADPDWKVVPQAIQRRIDVYEARIAVAESEDWPPTDDLRPGGPVPIDERELARLGMDPQRDCARIADEPDPDPRHRRFVTAAASACTAIVDRRRTTDFDASTATVLGIVADVRGGRPVDPTRERTDAVRELRDESRSTLVDLRAVPTADVPSSTAWRAALRLAEDRASGYDLRLRALESGEARRVESAFDTKRFRTVMGAPGWELGALGLEQRDCGRLRS